MPLVSYHGYDGIKELDDMVQNLRNSIYTELSISLVAKIFTCIHTILVHQEIDNFADRLYPKYISQSFKFKPVIMVILGYVRF